ncbi:hypothetical protein MC7420_266 [Coleofasciculus chthonoplastes PCC 7420]|uniref:Uncharacterized protein n=1 Tax=Coleofasciculus chthonoplastes PCC 7420 TaxID=118168 RepID=B4VKP5_9CYAN|nr:hypothetical protein MC7420_266 [Coleofasciculus chthonoplastes PCC 7420]
MARLGAGGEFSESVISASSLRLRWVNTRKPLSSKFERI